MLNTSGRLKLLASFSGRIARVLPAMLPRRCLHRLQPPSWPTLNRRRALVLLASGVASFAACGSLHSFNSLPECALIGPSPLPPSTTADEASHFSFHSAQHHTLTINDTSPLTIAKILEQLGVFFKRCRDATVMVVRCAVVSIVLFPSSLLFILNRISCGYIASELTVARVLTPSLQLLGPAAIKFGQWASSRDDLFPPVVTVELGRLQSDTESHALEHTLHEIEKMLSAFRASHPCNLDVKLEDIERVPIGSGSIAQVHRAKLVGLTPKSAVDVVVKVLHPSVQERLLLDTQIFCSLAKLISRLPKAWTFGAEAAAAQFRGHLMAQLDLSVEHSNIQRFRANFRSNSTIVFPTVFDGLCTDSCLVETWEEGESLRDFFFRVDAASLAQSHPTLDFHPDRSRSSLSPLLHKQPSTSELLDRMSANEIIQLSRDLGVAGAQAFLKMLVRDNFVHADLHPGNMIVRLEMCNGRPKPKLVMCDAGLVGEMNATATENFIELFHAVLRGDGRAAGLLMVKHAPRHECTDPEGFACGVKKIVDSVTSSGFQLKSTSVSGILTQMFSLARGHRVQVDGTYATTAVALAILEGTGKRLNSSIDLFKLALPLVVEVRAKKILHLG